MTLSLSIEQAERAAASQARRDLKKLVAAQARIAALARRVEELERSPSRLALEPARRLVKKLNSLRRQQGDHSGSTPSSDSVANSRGLALVIDNNWPQPDRDSGSVDIVGMVRALEALGFEVVLAAAKQHDGDQPSRNQLIAQGIACLTPTDAGSVDEFIRRRGAGLALAVMCRVFCGGEYLELLQSEAPQARLVFNSIDLNYVREERRALLLNDHALLATIEQIRRREEHIIANSDVTLVVSRTEFELLSETMPNALAVHMPLSRETRQPATEFKQRSGIGFVGGFLHAPNVDAVRHFLADVWPLVRKKLPTCEFSIVGPDVPSDLATDAPGVRVLGYKPDLVSWFDSLRLTVAPIRYGAGAKGKVASSLSNAVPCVATSLATEGMALSDGLGVVIADKPEDFARAIVRAYTDEATWRQLSGAGLDWAKHSLSPAAWQARLEAALSVIGL